MTTPTTDELVIWLRNMAIGLRASGEPTHDNDKGFDFAASRITELQDEVVRLRGAIEPYWWEWFGRREHEHTADNAREFAELLRRVRAALDQQGDRG